MTDPMRPIPGWPYLGDVPEWTALRHRMLRLVAREPRQIRVLYNYEKARPDEWWCGERLLSDDEQDAMRWLYDENLLEGYYRSKMAINSGVITWPSQPGTDLKAIWDRDHPETEEQ